MEHAALLLVARDLRKRLAQLKLPTMLAMAAPGLEASLPLIAAFVEAFEDLADRVLAAEARLQLLEGMGGAVDEFAAQLDGATTLDLMRPAIDPAAPLDMDLTPA